MADSEFIYFQFKKEISAMISEFAYVWISRLLTDLTIFSVFAPLMSDVTPSYGSPSPNQLMYNSNWSFYLRKQT